MNPRPLLMILLLSLAACSARERTTELSAIDPFGGYRYGSLSKSAPKQPSKTFVVMTFSGGGTRAAALATGALEGMASSIIDDHGTPINLAEQIDIISSVSGGSVAAAYYGLHGQEGLPQFTANFLKRNVQGHLIGEALLPWTWFRLATPSYARIDALRDYFDDNVFDHATYDSLLNPKPAPQSRRPYVVLNAADMSNGAVFSFTQDQFDLICSDLAKLPVADAVAASAAFPVALTALTLKNRSPCKAQSDALKDELSGWKHSDLAKREGPPRPVSMTKALESQAEHPGRYRRGVIELGYLNEENNAPYIQLLDGGISDNLGLTNPLTLMTSTDYTPSILSRINKGEIDRIIVVVVNARSEPDNSYGASAGPPGLISTLLTTIGTPIDGTSFAMLERLQAILTDAGAEAVETKVVPVDFDFITDPGCRRRFKNIGTSWGLDSGEVDALLGLGSAMVRKAATDLGGSTLGKSPTVDEACSTLAAVD